VLLLLCQPFLPDTIKARVQGTQNFKRFLSLRLGVWGVLSRSRGSLALCMHIIESCLLLCRLHCFILCDSATFGNCKRGHCMGYHPDEVIYVLKHLVLLLGVGYHPPTLAKVIQPSQTAPSLFQPYRWSVPSRWALPWSSSFIDSSESECERDGVARR
jgi:hypothetical protein